MLVAELEDKNNKLKKDQASIKSKFIQEVMGLEDQIQ